MRKCGETIYDWVQRDPQDALDSYFYVKAAHDALLEELKRKCHETGEIVSKSNAKMRKIKKKLKTLNESRAVDMLEASGYDPLSFARIRVDADSIKAKMGVTEGNKILKILKDGGCFDERTIEYYGFKP